MNNTDTCFSKVNFDIVYKYIDEQIKRDDTKFYTYDNSNKSGHYEFYLKDTTSISVKDNKHWTLAIISKEKGISSLAIWGNERIVNKCQQMFCKILSEANSSAIIFSIEK